MTLAGPFSVSDENWDGQPVRLRSGRSRWDDVLHRDRRRTQADVNAGKVTNKATATTTHNGQTVTSNEATDTATVVLGSGSTMTDSAFQLKDDLSPWTIADFEILLNNRNVVVATNPGQFYYHQRATNPYSCPPSGSST